MVYQLTFFRVHKKLFMNIGQSCFQVLDGIILVLILW